MKNKKPSPVKKSSKKFKKQTQQYSGKTAKPKKIGAGNYNLVKQIGTDLVNKENLKNIYDYYHKMLLFNKINHAFISSLLNECGEPTLQQSEVENVIKQYSYVGRLSIIMDGIQEMLKDEKNKDNYKKISDINKIYNAINPVYKYSDFVNLIGECCSRGNEDNDYFFTSACNNNGLSDLEVNDYNLKNCFRFFCNSLFFNILYRNYSDGCNLLIINKSTKDKKGNDKIEPIFIETGFDNVSLDIPICFSEAIKEHLYSKFQKIRVFYENKINTEEQNGKYLHFLQDALDNYTMTKEKIDNIIINTIKQAKYLNIEKQELEEYFKFIFNQWCRKLNELYGIFKNKNKENSPEQLLQGIDDEYMIKILEQQKELINSYLSQNTQIDTKAIEQKQIDLELKEEEYLQDTTNSNNNLYKELTLLRYQKQQLENKGLSKEMSSFIDKIYKWQNVLLEGKNAEIDIQEKNIKEQDKSKEQQTGGIGFAYYLLSFFEQEEHKNILDTLVSSNPKLKEIYYELKSMLGYGNGIGQAIDIKCIYDNLKEDDRLEFENYVLQNFNVSLADIQKNENNDIQKNDNKKENQKEIKNEQPKRGSWSCCGQGATNTL